MKRHSAAVRGRAGVLPGGITLLSALILLLAFTPSASASFQFLTKWGGCCSGDGQFNQPWGVATDSSGKVYVSDLYNSRIEKFDSSGTFLAKWGSNGSGDGQFEGARGVATDSSGNVYVSDLGNYRIEKFDSSGTFLAKWGSNGSGDGQFGFAYDLATDSSGNVYVADASNNRIQKFDSSGTFLAKWGSPGSGNGQFNDPYGIATDSSGNVYVADTSNNRIQKFDSSGNFLAKWGSNGPGDGQFNGGAYGVATDSLGNVYVTDGSNRIQKFDSSGTFLAKWGDGTYGGGDGQFNGAISLAIDASGNVYVVDSGNYRIQKFRQVTQAAVDSGPSGPTNDPSPSFAFSSEPGESFECRLDSSQEADFQPCSSPKPYSSLADGPHTFEVRANNPLGYSGPPASRSFTVDTIPPDTTITSGPSGSTNDPTPSLGFSSSQVGSSFECRIDSGSYSACGSPNTTAHLTDGSHTFYVRATDPAGNTDPAAATRTFTVQTASVGISGTTLVVTAAPGAKDNLRITRPSGSVLRVTDLPSGAYTASGVHTGTGCTPSGDYTANCSGEIARIQVSAGDRGDQVVNSTGVQSSLSGGSASDTLIGGSSKDALTGGPDPDVLQGMNGNDELFARDLAFDTTINCDGGIGTPGSADKVDLDKLPKDPDSVVKGCESKTRH